MSLPPSASVVRPAVGDDLGALQELARRTIDARYRSFLGDENVDWFVNGGASDDHVESHFRQGHVRCMETGGDIVGLVITDEPTIDLLMIDVDHQRQGLGKTLLSRTEEMLFARFREIRLETFATNLAAIAFYGACGWSARGPLESEPDKIEFMRHRGTEGAS